MWFVLARSFLQLRILQRKLETFFSSSVALDGVKGVPREDGADAALGQR